MKNKKAGTKNMWFLGILELIWGLWSVL